MTDQERIAELEQALLPFAVRFTYVKWLEDDDHEIGVHLGDLRDAFAAMADRIEPLLKERNAKAIARRMKAIEAAREQASDGADLTKPKSRRGRKKSHIPEEPT